MVDHPGAGWLVHGGSPRGRGGARRTRRGARDRARGVGVARTGTHPTIVHKRDLLSTISGPLTISKHPIWNGLRYGATLSCPGQE